MPTKKIQAELQEILYEIVSYEEHINLHTLHVAPAYKLSAKNLMRYLLLRRHDLRKYHDALSELGVSSIRSSQGYILSNLYQVVHNLNLINYNTQLEKPNVDFIGYQKSKKLLKKHANSLFNKKRNKTFTEIMVTLPEEAATNPNLVFEMIQSGMEVARINLSHGDLEQWTQMVHNVKSASAGLGVDVKIYMDLSGPKIRTNAFEYISHKGKKKNAITITKGEHLVLTKGFPNTQPSVFGSHNEQVTMATIGVSLPEIIDAARIGDKIIFDDGMIHAKVIDKSNDSLEIIIIDCFKNKLGSEKGINLPDTTLKLPALTEKDLIDLPFIAAHADMVGYSFVRNAQDVDTLYAALTSLHADDIGVVFKIENQEAFHNLPQILTKGMERDKIGVMIARGDLAVEIGFERIAEVQNQILWICEAAHIPVIWATQVLDNLAKTGIPTRAEISDATLGVQAECIMLNKGPFITDAIRVLKDVIVRMESHGFKNKGQWRALNIARRALDLAGFAPVTDSEEE